MIATLRTILVPLASLKFTVTLFVLAMILIFAGTLAQRFQGNWEVVNTYFRSTHVWIPLQVFVPEAMGMVRRTFLFPGGFIIGGLLLVNLLAAHAVRFKLSWKRAGVLVIHTGLIVLLLGEAVTALSADEGLMNIRQGSHASFAEDLREVELAIIDPDHGDREHVTVIPQSILEQAEGDEAIGHESLPFDIQVLSWMPNSALLGPQQRAATTAANLATTGHGTTISVMAQLTVSGVESQTNHPAAYISLSRDGKDLGTYLVTNHFAMLVAIEPRQTVEVEGKTWQIELRFRRIYKPYTIHVLETKHEKFVGTEIPRNFSSLVRVVDPEANEDRQVLIWMNHPLRYRGDTLFQSQMGQVAIPDATGAATPFTGLQVVSNPGWLLPYISCVLVSVGLVVHFGVMLVKFTGRTLT